MFLHRRLWRAKSGGYPPKRSKGGPEAEPGYKTGRRSLRCGNMMGEEEPEYEGSAWHTGHIQEVLTVIQSFKISS